MAQAVECGVVSISSADLFPANLDGVGVGNRVGVGDCRERQNQCEGGDEQLFNEDNFNK